MRTILGLAVLLVPVGAHADRTTTVNLGGWFGAVEDKGDEIAGAVVPSGGPRITLGWEPAPIQLPPTPGYKVEVGLVPELTGALVMNEDQGEALLGVGVRGELRIGQLDQGLKGSMRGAFYLAVRALVVGTEQDPAFEVVFGEYIYLGKSRIRLGGEINVITRRDATDYMDRDQTGVLASMYIGFAL